MRKFTIVLDEIQSGKEKRSMDLEDWLKEAMLGLIIKRPDFGILGFSVEEINV